MNQKQAVIHYLLVIRVLQDWFDNEFISQREFDEIKAIVAEKYMLSEKSIYR